MLFRPFLKSLLLLLVIAFIEKSMFALYHTELSSELGATELFATLLWGVRFDLAIATALALLVTLVAWLLHRLMRRQLLPTMRWGTFLAGALIIGIQGADLLYYGEAGRHLGYELKEWYNSGSSLAVAALQSYTLPVILQLLLYVPLYFATRRLFGSSAPAAAPAPFPRTLILEAQLVAILLLSVILVRGGLQAIPLEPLHAQQIGSSQRAALALNGGYNAIHSSLSSHLVAPRFAGAPSAEAVARYDALQKQPDALLSAPQPNANVIFVLLESWSASYMQSYGFDKPTTPHFDRLRGEGITSQAMMTGGHRTTEGMFSIFCSLQNPLGKTVAQSQLQNYEYLCLPQIARSRSYSSAFFQGTNANTSGTGAFAQMLGFSESYGKNEMPPGTLPDNSWGRHDPDIYRFVLDKLHAMPQPFMVGINTNSTHDIVLPPGVAATFTGDVPPYLNTLHFADEALADFVAAVRNDPQLKDTILVLVADHPGLAPPDAYRASMVPFVLLGSGVTPQMIPEVLSQRDIAPSIADLLGFPPQQQFTGQSMFRDISPRFADYYHQNTLGGISNGQLTETTLGENQTTCFDLPYPQQHPSKRLCDTSAEQLAATTLAYTHVSQFRLFNGETYRVRHTK